MSLANTNAQDKTEGTFPKWSHFMSTVSFFVTCYDKHLGKYRFNSTQISKSSMLKSVFLPFFFLANSIRDLYCIQKQGIHLHISALPYMRDMFYMVTV